MLLPRLQRDAERQLPVGWIPMVIEQFRKWE